MAPKKISCRNDANTAFKIDCKKIDCDIDYFKLLGISSTITGKEFHKLITNTLTPQYHPDKNMAYKDPAGLITTALQEISSVFFLNKKTLNDQFFSDYVEVYKAPHCGFFKATYVSKSGKVSQELREIKKAGGFSQYFEQEKAKIDQKNEKAKLANSKKSSSTVETSADKKTPLAENNDKKTDSNKSFELTTAQCQTVKTILQNCDDSEHAINLISSKINSGATYLEPLKACLEMNDHLNSSDSLISVCGATLYPVCFFDTAEL